MANRNLLSLENNSVAALACLRFGASGGINNQGLNKALNRLLKLSSEDAIPRAYKMLLIVITYGEGVWPSAGCKNFKFFLSCLNAAGAKDFIAESHLFGLAANTSRSEIVQIMLAENFAPDPQVLKDLLSKCEKRLIFKPVSVPAGKQQARITVDYDRLEKIRSVLREKLLHLEVGELHKRSRHKI